MSCESADLPFKRLDRAGRPTPTILAAFVTDMPSGRTSAFMNLPGCSISTDMLGFLRMPLSGLWVTGQLKMVIDFDRSVARNATLSKETDWSIFLDFQMG